MRRAITESLTKRGDAYQMSAATFPGMRLSSYGWAIAAALLATNAVGAPSPAAKSKVENAPLPSAPADVTLVGKALHAKELPKAITAADRAKLDAAVAELKQDRFEAGASIFRTWATTGAPKQITHEDAMLTAFWVFREGILTKHEELATAADRLRFFEERNAAIDDSLALLRGAAIAKKPALVAKLVVFTAYVRDAKGDERRERQVNRDAFENEIKQHDAKAEEVKLERDKLRSSFGGSDPKSTPILQLLASLVKSANDVRHAK